MTASNLIMSEDAVIPRLDDHKRIHLSKALSYILRHGATKEKLTMTDDGYILVKEIVCVGLGNKGKVKGDVTSIYLICPHI